MTTREVKTKSWFERILGSFVGVMFGLVFFVASFVVIFVNEGRAVHRARVLEAGRGAVVSLASPTPSPANEGKLVHFTGSLATEAVLEDPAFAFRAPGVRLERRVEMFQWKEKTESRSRSNVGGSETTTTVYTYETTWSEAPIDSSAFKEREHVNPPMPVQTARFAASDVAVGGFLLSSALVDQVEGWQSVAPTEAQVPVVAATVGRPVAIRGGVLTTAADPAAPHVGDLRITLRVAPAGQPVTVLAKQTGRTLAPWVTSDDTLEPTLRMGTESASALFGELETENTVMTWVFRWGGFLAMWIGLLLIFRPAAVLADVLPWIGRLVQGGVGMVTFVIALGLSLVTVAVGWMAFRPLVAVPLTVGGVGLAVFAIVRKTRRAPA
ncbi:MAG: TMEM43 family protein [Polyangiales bacterium]